MNLPITSSKLSLSTSSHFIAAFSLCFLLGTQVAFGQSNSSFHTNQGGMSHDLTSEVGGGEDQCLVMIYDHLFDGEHSHAADPIASDRGTCQRPLLTGGCLACKSKSQCIDCCQDNFSDNERRGCITGCETKWECISLVVQ